MKKLLLFIPIIIVASCINKDPNLDDAKYLAMQQEYETTKTKITFDKTAFFDENKAAMLTKINLFKKLKDSTNTFENAKTDSTFYLDKVSIKTINYSSYSYRTQNSKEAVKAVFLPKDGNEFAQDTFAEAYDQLYTCGLAETNDSCIQIPNELLKEFLDIKYAFVISGYRIMEPKLEDSKNFSSGLFFANITAYDLVKNEPVLKFSATATNSEEISYTENRYFKTKPINAMTRDFEKNIRKGIIEACKKHFDFTNR